MKNSIILGLLVSTSLVHAELRSLDDSELSLTTGEGLGMALENFAFSTEDADATISGIKNSNNEDITVKWTDFFIYGEGSNYGENEVLTNIGTYKHPWVLQSVRGSSAPEYMSVADDIALLELKTDAYLNPLQNSGDFILHSRYQGCIWGYEGCGTTTAQDPFIAVTNITSEINTFNAEIAALNAVYQPSYGSQISSELIAEAESVQSPGGVVYEQQLVIEARQADLAQAIRDYESANPGEYKAAKAAAGAERTTLAALYENTDQSVDFGEKYSCWGGCTSQERAYNNQVDVFEDATDVVFAIEGNWETENLALAQANRGLGEILSSEDSKDSSGKTLAERMSDADRYQVLCGESANQDGCADGLLVQRNNEKGVVNEIAMSLSAGQQRRGGMDIGSRFEFEVISENKNTGAVTRETDFLGFDFRGLYIDGSYFRLWSREDRDTGLSELNGEIRLRFFAKELAISACGVECQIIEEADADPENNIYADSEAERLRKLTLRDSTSLKLKNYLFDLNLGYGEVQPLKFQVTSDGNFVFELGFPDFETTGKERTVENVQEFFSDYYDNAPKSNFIVGQVQLGAVPETGPNYGDLGGLRAVGLRAQYLRIESYDIN